MNTVPPHELNQLGLPAEHFIRSDAKSWRGPCPRCGGHRRFVIFTDKAFPHWNYFCDGCAFQGWADQLNAALKQPISDDLRRQWDERNLHEQTQRDNERRVKLAQFSLHEIWAEYHERLQDENRAWWRAQGIPDEWQDWWQLGYISDKTYRHNEQLLHSAAYTIPYFHYNPTSPNHDRQFKTMQYRLVDAPTADRYRFEHGLNATYYQTNPYDPIADEVIICEGAKKAMCAFIHAFHKNTVLAIPSKSTTAGVALVVKPCGRVWLMLDPDADPQAQKLAADIGPNARVVTLPCKLDDLLIKHGGTAADLKQAMRFSTTPPSPRWGEGRVRGNL